MPKTRTDRLVMDFGLPDQDTATEDIALSLSVPKASLPPACMEMRADARSLPLPDASADLVVTSPPYWRKRDYGYDGQLGQEKTPEGFVANLIDALREWRRVLAPHGSVFLNIGDTYHRKSLAGIPGLLEAAARANGWSLRNRIVWCKEGGIPEPATDRLAGRHEYVLHLAQGSGYYYDSHGYRERLGSTATPGDVWAIPLRRNLGGHLASFPDELVARIVTLACPLAVCTLCGVPRRRILERTAELDPARPQAARAMELASAAKLTPAHIAAIQSTGISDVGKLAAVQTGTGKNSAAVRALAAEAKLALGSYFREFTAARSRTTGWTDCGCGAPWRPGVVLDPFCGTGTTGRVASAMGRSAVCADLAPDAVTAGWHPARTPATS